MDRPKGLHYKSSKKLYCVICGKPIDSAGNKMKKFCSEECHYQHIKNTRIKYRTCRACGREFRVSNHYRFVCSDRCRKIINDINVKNHTSTEEHKTKHRQHAREIRKTEEGYLRHLYSRMKYYAGEGVSFDELKQLYNSTNNCFYCGVEVKPYTRFKTIDHKIPISKGGKNELKNLVISCLSCNSGKCDMTDSEYKIYRSNKNENSKNI